jgi:hypothetical protein
VRPPYGSRNIFRRPVGPFVHCLRRPFGALTRSAKTARSDRRTLICRTSYSRSSWTPPRPRWVVLHRRLTSDEVGPAPTSATGDTAKNSRKALTSGRLGFRDFLIVVFLEPPSQRTLASGTRMMIWFGVMIMAHILLGLPGRGVLTRSQRAATSAV